MRLEIIAASLLPLLALARTDLSGCTSSISGPSLIWYVPGSCELCEIPDCGGGSAPPITDNPACANYKGTATYSPSFLSGCGGATATTTATDGGPKSAGAGPTSTPAITGSGSETSGLVTSTVTLIATNSTVTSITSVSSFSNSTMAAISSAAPSNPYAATTEAASTTAAVTPSSPSTAASSSSTGAAGIMTVGLNMGGMIVAVGVGAMAML